jgi:hypothetical protein
MSYLWNDPRRTGAAPSVSNMQTITVTSAPPIDWQARATAAAAEIRRLREVLEEVDIRLCDHGFDDDSYTRTLIADALQETTDVG